MTSLRPRHPVQGKGGEVALEVGAEGDRKPINGTPARPDAVGSSRKGFPVFWVVIAGFFVIILAYMQFMSNIKGRNSLMSEDLGYPVVDSHECGDEDQRVFNVFEWTVQLGAYIHPNLTTGTFEIPNTNGKKVRGLKARGRIRKEAILFAMPPQLLLNLGMLQKHHTLKKIYKEIAPLHEGLVGLAVLLIHESLNKTSFWRPYLCSLPKHVPLPIFYSPRKLARVRREDVPPHQMQRFDDLVETRRDTLEVSYVSVMPKLFAKYPHMFSPKDYTYARWAWACSIILARTWGRKIHDDVISNRTGENLTEVHTLVPAADMPNHENGAYEARQAPDGTLLLKAKQALRRGDQVFISYGKKCSAEFLANYGFIPPNNTDYPCKLVWSDTPANSTKGQIAQVNQTKTNLTAWRSRWRKNFAHFYGNLEKAQRAATRDPEGFASAAKNYSFSPINLYAKLA